MVNNLFWRICFSPSGFFKEDALTEISACASSGLNALFCLSHAIFIYLSSAGFRTPGKRTIDVEEIFHTVDGLCADEALLSL